MTLDELHDWMRAHGAVSARIDADGGIALTLGDPPAVEHGDTARTQHLRERLRQSRTYATPEEDPDLYGCKPPGWDD